MPPIFSSNRIAPIGRSMPKLVPIPSSPRKRAPVVGVQRGLEVGVAALGPRGHDAALAELERHVLDDDAARGGRDREADDALGGVLVRAGEDLAARHVALAVGVDPGAALDVQRQVGAGRLDADLARGRRAARSASPGSRAARPTPRRGRRGPGTARGSTKSVKSAVPIPACWAAAAVGHSVIDQRRVEHQLAQRGAGAGGAGEPRRVDAGQRVRVLGGLDPQRGVDVSASASSLTGTPSRCASRAALQKPSSWPGSDGPQQRPRLALEDLALQRQQQRRGVRRRD